MTKVLSQNKIAEREEGGGSGGLLIDVHNNAGPGHIKLCRLYRCRFYKTFFGFVTNGAVK